MNYDFKRTIYGRILVLTNAGSNTTDYKAIQWKNGEKKFQKVLPIFERARLFFSGWCS